MAEDQAPPWKLDILRFIDDQAPRLKHNRLFAYQPYPKQAEFLALGATKRERLLMAGNKVGKTYTGAFEAACHATGLYPSWWAGARFDEPTDGWIAGETSELVRDVQQKLLFGTPGVEADWGSGMIPKDCLVGRSLGHGVSNFFDTVMIKHVSGGTSTIGAKSYTQPVARWQASYLHWIWLDEQPQPVELYSEGLARLRGNGICYCTFTPLKGNDATVRRFREPENEAARRDRGIVQMGLADAEHFTPEEKEQRLAGYPAHERAAREFGEPFLGSGAVFENVVEADIVTDLPLHTVPHHWPLLWGVDFGISHPFAAVLGAIDPATDTLYILEAFKVTSEIPLLHAQRMLAIAPGVPVAFPHDGVAREAGTGLALAAQYKAVGLKMRPTHAQSKDGGYRTEPAIQDMLSRMRTGRFKVNSHLVEWWSEFRSYYRKTGQIVKENDDLMSASRILTLDIRFAQVRGEHDQFGRPVPPKWLGGSRPTHRDPDWLGQQTGHRRLG